MTFGPGSVIAGRYHADRLVGTGGMGEVWAGELVEAGQKVALKRLLPAASQHHEVVARFRREAVLLGRIQSEYVARVFDFVDDQVFGPVLVMEFIEGPSLAHILEDRKLEVEEAVDLVVDLALALCDLHDAKVVHRDLKPGNIIMRPLDDGRSRAVIVDFGIGRQLTSADNPDEITGITRANIALGTVEYMAPEQILNSRDVTPLTDIYAIGAILYRAVAGVHAFGARRGEELARAKLIEDAPKLDTGRRDEIAREMTEICTRCLKKRPAQRFASARDLLAAVKRIQDRVRIAELDLDSTTADGGRTRVVEGMRDVLPIRPSPAAPTRTAASPPPNPERTDPVQGAPEPQNQQRPGPVAASNHPIAAPVPSTRGVRLSSPNIDPRGSNSDLRSVNPIANDPRASHVEIAPGSSPRPSQHQPMGPPPASQGNVQAQGAPRASLASIPDMRASLPSISEGRRDMASMPDTRQALPSIHEGRPPLPSLAESMGPRSFAEPPQRGVGFATLALSVLAAFAVGGALGLVLAPSANNERVSAAPGASANAPALPACPACPSQAPSVVAESATPAASTSASPAASASNAPSSAPQEAPPPPAAPAPQAPGGDTRPMPTAPPGPTPAASKPVSPSTL